MSLRRRQILTLLAAGSAGALAGCGGGGDDDFAPTRFMWLANVNPEATSADVRFGDTLVAAGLPFPGLTPRVEIVFGNYSFFVRNRPGVAPAIFDNVIVDELSPAMTVYYRKGTSTRLGSSPVGIVNYFDSAVPLDVELFDDRGGVQRSRLDFKAAVPQASQSQNCRLRLYSAASGVLVYDSGLRFREGAILIFPADPVSGLVAVAGLSYTESDARLVPWANTIGR